ncbi:MAG: (2Fe-2S)-binding protein [Betaproteobacteria bacterium]|nr:(2Fe-2S)-binding protein [Betaproteobacteria bacterium]
MPLDQEIEFTLNGGPRRVAVNPEMSALTMLRETLGLTGTKYGCGEGECGACTVLLDGRPVNACLLFAVDCDGRELVTIEGLASDPVAGRVQQAFVEYGAVQCGFCTPGFVMQAKTLVERHLGADRNAIARGIEGNLCRCTGYRKIIDAIASVASAK